MKLLRRIYKSINPTQPSLFLPKEYVSPRGMEGLRVAKTVLPEEPLPFNEVFINAKKELSK